jgi:hypothetical protein
MYTRKGMMKNLSIQNSHFLFVGKMNLENIQLIFGFSLYVIVVTLSFYFLRLGCIYNNRRLISYGVLTIIFSIIVPPLVLATAIEFLLESFLNLAYKYPILHLLFFILISGVCIYAFYDSAKGILYSETADKVVSVCMGLTAAAFGYAFFLIFIGIAGATIVTLVLSFFVALIVSGIALKR